MKEFIKRNYVFYTTDESFDYNDVFGSSTYNLFVDHGFLISLDKFLNPIIETLHPYGHFRLEMEKIKTLAELKQYLIDNLKEAQKIENKKEILKLIEKIKEDNKC